MFLSQQSYSHQFGSFGSFFKPLGYNFMHKTIVFEMIFEVCWKSFFFFLQPPLRLVLFLGSSMYSAQIWMKSISYDALKGQCSHLAPLLKAGVNEEEFVRECQACCNN